MGRPLGGETAHPVAFPHLLTPRSSHSSPDPWLDLAERIAYTVIGADLALAGYQRDVAALSRGALIST